MKSRYAYQHTSNIDAQPEIKAALLSWIESVDLEGGWGVSFDKPKVEPLEYKGRDGFIPHGHNRGGFDLVYMSDVSMCHGSGCGPDLSRIDTVVEGAYKDAITWFKDQKFIGLEHLKDDEITYRNLHEIGRPELGEQLSEVESEYMRCPVWWGIRAMYEGIDAYGVHTICIHASGNVNEYYDPFGKGSEDKGEFEIRFKTVSGLKRQLQRIKSKVEGAF